MKVLFLSDLHANQYSSAAFFARLQKTISRLSPDLILFSGDLLTYSRFPNKALAASLFDNLSAPFGIFACLGNHDYSDYTTLDSEGQAVAGSPNGHPLIQGIKRLFGAPRSERQRSVSDPLPYNQELLKFYADHYVTVLNNETVRIGHGNAAINLTGLGDLSAGHLSPSKAYQGYSPHLPGIVFAHSPDAYAYLTCFPGDLFLFGHTHGGQVNLPFLWKRITPIRDKSLRSGLYVRDNRSLFVSRGVGATFPFRLFAPPQVVLFELIRGGPLVQEAPAASPLERASATPSRGGSANDLPPNPVRSSPSYPSNDSTRYDSGTSGSGGSAM